MAKVSIITLSVLFLIFGYSASAGLPPPTIIDSTKIEEWLVDIGNFLLGAGVILAVIVIVYSGIRWMMAGGDPKGAGEAKNILTAGIWGVAIILGVGLIITTVATVVTGDFFGSGSGGGGTIRYGCDSSGSCVVMSNGPYTSSTCNNACSGGGATRYGCNSFGNCVVMSNGPYTDSSCNNACSAQPATPQITSISPSTANAYDIITIQGSDLGRTVEVFDAGGVVATFTGNINSFFTRVTFNIQDRLSPGSYSVRVIGASSTPSNSVSLTVR